MAEFIFYTSESDRADLLRTVIDCGVSAIPNVRYARAKPAFFRDVDEMIREGKWPECNSFFLHGSFSKAPPFMDHWGGERGKNGGFSIDGSRGGPLFSFSLPESDRVGKAILIRRALLAHAREFWDDGITSSWRPSEELRAEYSKIVMALKSQMHRVNLGGHWVYVSSQARLDLQEGVARFLINGKWFGKRHLLSPKRGKKLPL